MSSHTLTATRSQVGQNVASVRGWLTAVGVASMVLGTAAIVYNGISTIASVVVFGSLLMLFGGLQVVHALQVREWSGFFLYLLDGIIRATVGTLLVMYPGTGALSLTLVVSFYFIAGGLFKAFGATMLKFPSWGWSVVSALISVALGVMLVLQWPASSTWFIGFAVGVELFFYGWALLMFAAAIKSLVPSNA
jgi:uncharacterized membrane protein HdeD (DUF308 family)